MRVSSAVFLRHPTIRFLISGGVVAVVSVSMTTALRLAGLPFQIAFAFGYCCALAVHFVLHRSFTFASKEAYALTGPRQATRFIATALTQYVLIAFGVAVLAPLLGLRDLVVYLILIVCMSGGNFFITRHRIFHSIAAGSGR